MLILCDNKFYYLERINKLEQVKTKFLNLRWTTLKIKQFIILARIFHITYVNTKHN